MTQASSQERIMQSPPYPALTIAKWFIAWAEAEDEEISNLKLQKLLYYAQGHYLAARQRPLFGDQIQAWSHGPVVSGVYHQFKGFGRSSIELPDEDPFTWDDVDDDTAGILSTVWNTYGGYSAGHLRDMTHAETPWRKYFRQDQYGTVIPEADIRKFFAEQTG